MARTALDTAEKVDRLVAVFYERLLADPLVRHHFIDLNLPAHLPRVAAFWKMVLFGGPADGTMMAKHFVHHRTKPMLPAHFDRWLEHFAATVDELHEGGQAEEVKQRARTIAAVMQAKIGAL